MHMCCKMYPSQARYEAHSSSCFHRVLVEFNLFCQFSKSCVARREIGEPVPRKEGNGKPMMPALQLLRLAKRHIYGRSNVEQCKNLVCSPIHS